MSISSTLKTWYLQNKRDLPWRNTCNPYHIWVSEVILQQTRIAQGLPYYEKFIGTFPDIEALAYTPEEKLLKIWQGLGYYSRARNLQKGARLIMDKYHGKLPGNYNDLLSVYGIGDYTASAIASIAFNLPHAVVDGNVSRVISRIYGVFEPINQQDGKRKIQDIANSILDNEEPGIHNQAVMEFGALLCTPLNPGCEVCPLKNSCFAFKNNKVKELPIKSPKMEVQQRYFYYLVIVSDNQVLIKKRSKNDIWRGLYEFPLIESKEKVSIEDFLEGNNFISKFSDTSFIIKDQPVYYLHKLTHRSINTWFVNVNVEKFPDLLYNTCDKVSIEKISDYPVSRLIHKYLENFLLRK
jgi:A/G-specific adenine glycosylase